MQKNWLNIIKASSKKKNKNGYKKSYDTFVKEMGWGKGIHIHRWIGKLPRAKGGFTPGSKYMGLYNLLDKQLRYDPETGQVLEWFVKPYNKVDEIATYHDIGYDMGKNKGTCDKLMVKSLDLIPYGEIPKWGQTATNFFINTKKKLGLGVSKAKKNILRNFLGKKRNQIISHRKWREIKCCWEMK